MKGECTVRRAPAVENPPGTADATLAAVLRLAEAMLRRERVLPSARWSELPEEYAIGVHGRSFDAVANTLDEILAATPSSASPRFLNQLFGGREPAAVLAEMLAPLANISMYTFKAAGAQILVEREVITRLLEKAGFVGGEGALSPGGSISNLVAMYLARNRAVPTARRDGLPGERLTVYASQLSHYSVRKNAAILGMGRDNVRLVPADRTGRMRVADLRDMIRRDRELGASPIAVVATAGTTVLGAYDPLREIGEVAHEHGTWLHVDGALGASALLCRDHRHLLDGLEHADSLTWNAHKMMGVPLSCSALLVRHRGMLAENLREQAGYLFQADTDDLNPGVRSIQCGRRNDALKLWAAWYHLGDEGYDARIRRFFSLARYTAERIAGDPELELAAEPQSVNVCFEVRGRASAAICDRLDHDNLLKIGHGEVNGRTVIRMVCVDPALDEGRIDETLALIKRAAADLPATEGDAVG